MDQRKNEETENERERQMEEGLDVDVSLRFYQRYQLISFISITPSLLLAESCHLDGTCAHTHTGEAFH